MKNKKLLSAVLAFSVIISQFSTEVLAANKRKGREQEPKIVTNAEVIMGGNPLDLSTLVKGDVRGDVTFSLDGSFDSKLEGSTLTSGYHKELVSLNVRIAPSDGYKEFYQENAIEVAVLDKKTDGLDITLPDSLFGDAVADPEFSFDGEEVRRKISYEGTTSDGRTYGNSEKPTDAGNYKVIAEAETNDTIYTGSEDFEILKKNIKGAEIKANSPKYDRNMHNSEVISVLLDGTDITEFVNVDAVSHEDAGTYKFTVTAKENTSYTGRAEGEFTIRPKEITPVAEHIPDLIFTGHEQKPEITLKDGNYQLTEGRDYKVTFNNNLYVGRATAVIESLGGNYSFRPMEVDFNITIAEQSPYIRESAELPLDGELDLAKLVSGFEGEVHFTPYSDLKCSIEDNILSSGNKEGLIYIEAEAPAIDLNGDGKYEYANFKEEDAITVSVTDKKDGQLKFNRESLNVPCLSEIDLKAEGKGGKVTTIYVDEFGEKVDKPSEVGKYTCFAYITDDKLAGNAKAELVIEPLKVKASLKNEVTKAYDGGIDAGEVILNFNDGKKEVAIVTNGIFESSHAGNDIKIFINENSLRRDFPEYDIDFSEIRGNITPMEVKAVPVPYEEIKREYAGSENKSAPDVTLQFEGAEGNLIEIKAENNTFSDGHAGKDKAITLGEVENMGDYEITLPEVKGEITKRELTVIPENAKKTFGEKDPSFPFEADGLVDGDILNISLTREKGEDAGEYALTLSDDIYAPDYEVELYPKKSFLTIEKAVPFFNMRVYPESAKPGDEITIEIEASSENVICKLGTEEIDLAEENGVYKGNYYIDDNESLGARRVFTASILEDENYRSVDDILKTVTVTDKKVPEIYLTASESITYGNDAVISYEITSQEKEPEGAFRFFLDGEETEGAVKGLKGEITVPKDSLNAGKHLVSLTFTGEKGFADAKREITLDVEKKPLNINYEGEALSKGKEEKNEKALDGTLSLEGVIEGDDVSLMPSEKLQTADLGSFTEKGTFKASVVRPLGEGFILTGSDKDNYEVEHLPLCDVEVTEETEEEAENDTPDAEEEKVKFSIVEFFKNLFDKLFGR